MIFPSGLDYFFAVQNPRIAFNDQALRFAEVETNALTGLPLPYSGGFTTTFHLFSNSTHWAARCFVRQLDNLEQRYSAIGQFTRNTQGTPLVQANCLANGILVNGQRYPIIKMDWANGSTLNDYVNDAFANPNSLQRLPDSFLGIVKWLTESGIAHGDLQHGNLIVANQRIFLIDYDGMYLPKIKNLQPNQVGHLNYQHPLRKLGHYGKNMDRFSSIVIFLGLKAVVAKPDLWKNYDDGENILFTQKDFLEPVRSPLFDELKSISSIRKFAEGFERICQSPYESTPTLDAFLHGTYSVTPSPDLIRAGYEPRSQYSVVLAKDGTELLKNVGQRVEVVGRITDFRSGSTRGNKPYLFLNYGRWPNQTFTLVLWSEGLRKFSSMGSSLEGFLDQDVAVVGVLEEFMGKPQITIENPSQIHKISGSKVQADVQPPIIRPSIRDPISVRDLAKALSVPLGDVMLILIDLGEFKASNDIVPPELVDRVVERLARENVVQSKSGASSQSVRRTNVSPRARKDDRSISIEDAQALNRLYGNRPASSKLKPSSASKQRGAKRRPSLYKKPQSNLPSTPRAQPSNRFRSSAWTIVIIAGAAVAGYLVTYDLIGMIIGAGVGYLLLKWLQRD